MSYPSFPFPDTPSQALTEKYGINPPFREREVIREWVEDIFVRNGNEKLVELNTTVERAEKLDGRWVLTLRKEGPGKNHWWQEKFDAIVVASGHYNIPWIPQIPGLVEYDARFPGRVFHSKHFRDPAKFRGKRVIVVGASVSSSEIIHEILPYAQHPVVGSLRGAPIPAFGYVPWTHPHISIKKQIVKFDPDTGRIFFGDGSHLDNIDHVIFGTGYTFSLPYLANVQRKIKGASRRLPGVYQHTWNIEDPSLTFVGMVAILNPTHKPLLNLLTNLQARRRIHFPRIRMASRRHSPSSLWPSKTPTSNPRTTLLGEEQSRTIERREILLLNSPPFRRILGVPERYCGGSGAWDYGSCLTAF